MNGKQLLGNLLKQAVSHNKKRPRSKSPPHRHRITHRHTRRGRNEEIPTTEFWEEQRLQCQQGKLQEKINKLSEGPSSNEASIWSSDQFLKESQAELEALRREAELVSEP